MSRGYYGNADGIDYYRRPSRSLPLAMSSGPHENVRAYPIGHYGNRNSPVHESDSDKGGNQPRRRIAVACSRCRKRKIKCSGDQGNGNGQGCLNCKNAGIDPGQCQFLRVGSNSYPLADTSWPYSASGQKSPSLGAGQIGGGLEQYSSNISAPQSSMAPSSWPGSIQFSRAQTSNGCAVPSWVATPARPVYRQTFGANYSDGFIEAYNMQSPQYLLPSQDTQAPGANYGAQDLSRNWTPIGMTSRISHNGSFLDQDVHPRYGTSTFPYLNSNTSAATPDGSSLSFPAMTSLATSLPVPSSNADRILPTPTPKSVPMNSINNGVQVLSDTSPTYSSQGTSYKPSVPWGPESVTTGGSQSSTATTTSGDTSGVIGAARRKSSSPPSSSQETTFGYIPISHSPPAISAITASDYSSSRLPNSTRGIDGYGGSAHSALNGLSGDTLMSSHNSSSNLYSYTIGSSTRRGSNADTATLAGTLVNGQPYTRLRQSQPHHTTSFDALRPNSVETSSRIAHRASISSIDNSRHY